MRLPFVAITLMLALGCERVPPPTRPLGTLRPNIILISLDTVRADHMPFLGYSRQTMPNLAGVASEGTTFQAAFANSNTTLPSHVTMFTGMLPPSHGIFQPIFDGRREDPRPIELPSSIPTLPELLKRQGMKTIRFASSRDFFLDASIGLGRAFDELHPYGMDSEWTTARITQWLEHVDTRVPFFAFIHSKRPHAPYTLPVGYRNLFGENYKGPVIDNPEKLKELVSQDPLRSSFQGTLPGIWPESDVFAMLARKNEPKDIQRLRDLYDAALRLTDDYLGSVLKSLRSRNLLDKTILIITSDHGEEFMEHGRLLHDILHGEVLHVPMVIRIPGRPFRPVVKSRVQIADLTPTIWGLLGNKAIPSIEGTDLSSLILNFDPTEPEAIVHSEIYAQKKFLNQVGAASIATDEWKYIEEADGKRFLYASQSDPKEQTNLVDKKPEVAAQLRAQLLQKVRSLR